MQKNFYFLTNQLKFSNQAPRDPTHLWYKTVSKGKGEGSSQVA